MSTNPPPVQATSAKSESDRSLLELVDRLDSVVDSYSENGDAPAILPEIHQEMRVTPEQSSSEQIAPAISPSPCPSLSKKSPATTDQTTRIIVIEDDFREANVVANYLEQAGHQNVDRIPRVGALAELSRDVPDLLILPVKEATDLDLLKAKNAKSDLASIAVIGMIHSIGAGLKRKLLDLGAIDMISTPVDPYQLEARVRNAFHIRKLTERIDSETDRFEQVVTRRTAELEHSRQQMILSLARAAEHRDNETGNHVLRVGQYAGIIARQLNWTDSRIEMLEQAAQLHDVGKIGVPDNILFKPGKLDPEEFAVIEKHCSWGKSIIEPFSSREFQVLKTHARLGESILHIRSSPMLMMASRIAQTHHENWDGSGYPLGLAGEDIPIEGRITAVADVFDALSSKRPYKDAFPREKSFAILEEQRGVKFDPEVLNAFFECAEEITEVQIQLMDEE